MRRHAILHKVNYTTTLAGARAACLALRYRNEIAPVKLQNCILDFIPAFT